MMALSVSWSSLLCLLMSAMVVSQSVIAAPSIRFFVSSASCMACLLFPDCLLNSLNWSVSYVDFCLARRLEPEVFVDLGCPSVNVVEDDGNRSVCFHQFRLRRVVFSNLAGFCRFGCHLASFS